MRYTVRTAVGLVLLSGFVFMGSARGADACTSHLLVLSAMPVELGPLLANETIEHTVEIDGRSFYLGSLEGKNVILAMTGVGTVNARTTAELAFENFCGIGGVVFSGTSGGKGNIGDVVIASRWTLDSAPIPDDGKTWFATDATMLSVAQAAASSAALSSVAAVGDAACVDGDPEAAPLVQMPIPPTIQFVDKGHSSDPFGGHPLPCVPNGGDVFGCFPCKAPNYSTSTSDGPRFASGAAPFLTPDFFTWYSEWSASEEGDYDVVDMETAAVAKVAHEMGAPFIAFRAQSDGKGDPLGLPGFPFEFFVYRQLAADDAASVALAFVKAWTWPSP